MSAYIINIKMFLDPIPRNPMHSFQKAVQKVTVENNGKSKTIEVNRHSQFSIGPISKFWKKYRL